MENQISSSNTEVIRIDLADSSKNGLKGSETNTKLIAQIFRDAAEIAADSGGRLAAEGEIGWDGCMFPNEVLEKQETWNTILGAMIKVRDAHGWA